MEKIPQHILNARRAGESGENRGESPSASRPKYNVVDYVILAEFDIDKGNVIRYQYPRPCPAADEQYLASQMVPDGAHNCEEDWTVFFLNRNLTDEDSKKQRSIYSEEEVVAADNLDDNFTTSFEAIAYTLSGYDWVRLRANQQQCETVTFTRSTSTERESSSDEALNVKGTIAILDQDRNKLISIQANSYKVVEDRSTQQRHSDDSSEQRPLFVSLKCAVSDIIIGLEIYECNEQTLATWLGSTNTNNNENNINNNNDSTSPSITTTTTTTTTTTVTSDSPAAATTATTTAAETDAAPATIALCDEVRPFYYCLNYYKTKIDRSQYRRGAEVKALAVVTRYHSHTMVFKELLALSLELIMQQAGDTVESIVQKLFHAINDNPDICPQPQQPITSPQPDSAVDTTQNDATTAATTVATTNNNNNNNSSEIEEVISPQYINDLSVSKKRVNRWTIIGDLKLQYHRIIVDYYGGHVLSIPLALCSDEIHDPRISVRKLVEKFRENTMIIYNALLSEKRIVFISCSSLSASTGTIPPYNPLATSASNVSADALASSASATSVADGSSAAAAEGLPASAGEVACYVLASLFLVSPPLTGMLQRRFYPYASLVNLDFLSVPGFVAGVTNPMFEHRTGWWDLLCDVDTGKVRRNPTTYPAPHISQLPAHTQRDHDLITAVLSDIAAYRSRMRSQPHIAEDLIRSSFMQYTKDIVDLAVDDHQGNSARLMNDRTSAANYQESRELNVQRIREFKSTITFKRYLKDLQTEVANRTIKQIDVEHLIRRLRISNNLDELDLLSMYQQLLKHIRTNEQLLEFLSYLPETQGGIYPVAVALFHASDAVRLAAVAFLRRLDRIKEGSRCISKLNAFLLLAYERHSRLMPHTDTM